MSGLELSTLLTATLRLLMLLLLLLLLSLTGLTTCRALEEPHLPRWQRPCPRPRSRVNRLMMLMMTIMARGDRSTLTHFGQLIHRPTVLVGRKHTPWDPWMRFGQHQGRRFLVPELHFTQKSPRVGTSGRRRFAASKLTTKIRRNQSTPESRATPKSDP